MNELSQKKENLISEIMQNQEILKCLYYNNNNIDIFDKEVLPDIVAPQVLADISRINIFRNRKLPTETSPIQKTYISVFYGDIDYSVQTSNAWSGGAVKSPIWSKPVIHIYIISHESLDDNLFIGSRVEAIECELRKALSGKFKLDGFGKSYLDVSEYIYNMPMDYIGRRVTLEFVDDMPAGY